MTEVRDASSPPFAGYLLPGETVLWWDQPGQGLLLTPRDGLLIPFSLAWCGFAIFWESTVLRTDAPPFMALFGLPFVLIGLFLVFGRFLLDAWLRSHTLYALTDHRILIARAGLWPSFNAINLDRLPEATLNESADGRGTIRFGPSLPVWGNRGFTSWTPALDPTPQFLAITDARRVFAAIQERTQGANR